jgi:hypothetical protein
MPQLHFSISKHMDRSWYCIDPYRATVRPSPMPANFWGSEVSYWTKDNDPQFPLVNLGD